MGEWKGYSTLSFEGRLLIPTFSVYLWIVDTASKKYYYVGMTGDPHYPSARSAIHRLSGHFETKNRSTQNRIQLFLERNKIEVASATIKMHHWPITGFTSWEKPLRKFKKDELSVDEKTKYDEYRRMRKEVGCLERYLIFQIQKANKNSINGPVKEPSDPKQEFLPIIRNVNDIINHER